MTIGDLKVGSKLMFGAYGVRTPVPVTWLKATKDCIFLAEKVLDILPFDSAEPRNRNGNSYYAGNSNYELSNIHQFLNADGEDWFERTHYDDEEPVRYQRDIPGFLTHFEDYELASLQGKVCLPHLADIVDGGQTPKFELFRRKGIRTTATDDVITYRFGHGLDCNTFAEYWTQDASTCSSVRFISRGATFRSRSASTICGIRPKCSLSASVEVEKCAEYCWRIKPFGAVRPGQKQWEDAELMAFLGMSL